MRLRKIINSRGTGWGNQGFAWLSYDFIQAFGSDIYLMLSRTNYQPTSLARFKLAQCLLIMVQVLRDAGDDALEVQ